jgi:geranylgeranyl diphosphate synthase type I
MHCFILIHNDVTNHSTIHYGPSSALAPWKEAQEINAGDALFALSQLALTRLTKRRVPAATIVTALDLLNHTCVTLTGGKYLDIGFDGRTNVSVADYLAVVERRTAALTACACEMGALVAAIPESQRECLRSFGHHLGLAIQIRDDILGIWGNTTPAHKPAMVHATWPRKSLPILYGLEQSKELRDLLVHETLSEEDAQIGIKLLEEANCREYACQTMKKHYNQAVRALKEANLHNSATQTLHELVQALVASSEPNDTKMSSTPLLQRTPWESYAAES